MEGKGERRSGCNNFPFIPVFETPKRGSGGSASRWGLSARPPTLAPPYLQILATPLLSVRLSVAHDVLKQHATAAGGSRRIICIRDAVSVRFVLSLRAPMHLYDTILEINAAQKPAEACQLNI